MASAYVGLDYEQSPFGRLVGRQEREQMAARSLDSRRNQILQESLFLAAILFSCVSSPCALQTKRRKRYYSSSNVACASACLASENQPQRNLLFR